MAGNTQVIVTSGKSLTDIIDHLEALGTPGFKVVGSLEAALRAAFLDTQAKTHVITGSLKASGHTESDFDGDTWTGTIHYGGPLFGTPTPGPPNDPVDYAIYEMARGGDHDFMRDLPMYESSFEEAIASHFDGI